VSDIEREILDHYRTVRLSKRVRDEVWADLHRDVSERSVVIERDIERASRRVKGIEDNQARLIQLSYKGLVSDEVLAAEQQRLEQEKAQAHEMQGAAEAQALDIESALMEALDKTKNPRERYEACPPLERRLLNQAFFTQILVDDASEITSTKLTPVYSALSPWEPTLGQPAHGSAKGLHSANPGRSSVGRGSNYEPMVETVGIEPTSAIA
jgi:hypothetical protein